MPCEPKKHPAVLIVYGDGPANRSNLGVLNRTLDCFIKNGFACLVWDKPGSGASKGGFTYGKLFHERAQIVISGVKALKAHPLIDSDFIGIWGISQAGYVMPLALSQTNQIAFMVAVSCPAMDSIDQSAYLIKKQMLCEGHSIQDATKAEAHYKKRSIAQSYEEYLISAKHLNRIKIIKEMGWGRIASKDQFSPIDPDSEYFYNPIEVIKKTKIPVLAFFGEKDTQVDPLQGRLAYERALREAKNPAFKVKLIPNADHSLFPAKTGSIREIRQRSRKNKTQQAPEYFATLNKWLTRLLENRS